jgi:hypothetical protein
MSDLSPKCAPKRTSADHLNLWVHALALGGIPIRKRDLWTHRSNAGVDPVTDREVVVSGDRTTPDPRRAHTTTRFHLLGLQRCPYRLLRARSGYGDQISQRLDA